MTGPDVQAYQAAERLLRHRRGELVLGGRITPRWIDGGSRFWYTVDTDQGKRFIVADPGAGTRVTHEEPPADTGRAGQPGNPLEASSPDGRYAVHRAQHNLRVRQQGGTDERELTHDGTAEHDYAANPDYLMYSTLLGKIGLPYLPPAVAWSPDSTRILTHRTDQHGVRQAHLVQSAPADGAAPGLLTQRLPLAGDERVPLAELVVIDVAAGTVVRALAEPVPMPVMSPIFQRWAWWSDDGSSVYYLSWSRDARTLRLNRLDPASGEVRVLIEETGPTRVEPAQTQMQPPIVRVLPGGAEVLWYSQRDGWGHLYLYDAATREPRTQVTSGEWGVQEILHVDSERRVVYFVASGLVAADPYRRSVCRVGLDGTGFARVTDDDLDHTVTVAPGAAYFVDSASTTGTAPVITARGWDGRGLVELERADISRLLDAGWTPPEGVRATAAACETEVYGLLYRPHGFDPARRYPVIDTPYGIPVGTRVSPAFDPGLYGYDAEALAALGFVVIAVDGRGSPGRSKAFHDVSYGNLAGACGLDDHVSALRELAATRPWIDLGRVGVTGMSGGGFAAVRAMLDFPDVFSVGVAESGMHDFRFLNAGLAEPYNGPFDETTYAAASNVDSADRLTGRLLLVHGGLDDRVPPDLTLRLAERLIAADKDFDLFIVPGADHTYFGYEHHVVRRRWDFLVRHLLGAEPPAGHRLTPVPMDLEALAELFG